MNDESRLPEKRYKVPAVEQAIRIMLCLADSGNIPKSLTDICAEVGIHRSKAFSILNTLNIYGFVKKNPNRGGYVPGPGLLTITGKLLDTLNLPRIAEPVLYDLAKKAKATVALGVIADDKTYVVAQYMGAPGIGVSSPIGYVTPITYGAHGKAIISFLPEKEREEILKNKDLYFYGKPERFDESKLRKEIAECRRSGFALELGDIHPGMNAIAVPILDKNNYPTSYITIAGFFTREEALQIGPLAVAAVKTISKEAGQMMLWKTSGNGRNFMLSETKA